MSEEERLEKRMGGRMRLTKCCCCLSLDLGAKLLGGIFLLLTLGKYSLACLQLLCVKHYSGFATDEAQHHYGVINSVGDV